VAGDEAVLAVEKAAEAASRAGTSPNLVDLAIAALDSLINAGLRAGKEMRSVDVDRVLTVLRRAAERQVLPEHVRAVISAGLDSPVFRDVLAFMKGRIERSLGDAVKRIERGNRRLAAGGRGLLSRFLPGSCCGRKPAAKGKKARK